MPHSDVPPYDRTGRESPREGLVTEELIRKVSSVPSGEEDCS